MAAGGPGASAAAGTPRLPELRQEVPYSVGVVTGRPPARHRLVFASAVENAGPGPLVVVGTRHPGTGTMTADQLVDLVDSAGRVVGQRRHRAIGRLRYVREATHSHWHLLAFERYELRRASDGRLVAPDRKTGFCLGDRYRASPAPARAPRARAGAFVGPAQFDERCGLGRPGLRRVVEGISPGFGDDYKPAVEGQFIDVTRVPSGRYVLVHRTNVDGRVREVSRAGDVASVAVSLRRRADAAPSVRVTARCPGRARCPAR